MSDVSDAARVQILLADYAAVDGGGKVNALGVGFQFAILQPTGATAPQSVTVLVDVPASFGGSDMAFELTLYDEADDVVQTPGPLGQGGAIRLAQNVTLQEVNASSLNLPQYRFPRESLWCRHQVVANMQNGVPVQAGQAYEWRVAIDTVTRADWAARFYVPAPAGGIVIG